MINTLHLIRHRFGLKYFLFTDFLAQYSSSRLCYNLGKVKSGHPGYLKFRTDLHEPVEPFHFHFLLFGATQQNPFSLHIFSSKLKVNRAWGVPMYLLTMRNKNLTVNFDSEHLDRYLT